MRDPARWPWLFPALLVLAAACGESSSSGTSTGTTGGTTTTTTTTAPSVCADDPRAEVYTVGLKGSSPDGALTITFADADPAPPAKGNNTLVIDVTDADGKPVSGATITTSGYMPDHGHYTSVKPTVTPAAEPGRYSISPVTLFMPGIWEITFTVETADKTMLGSVKFSFCIDG